MLNIIFEDNHLLVVNKPPNLPTQPTPKGENSLEAQAKIYIKEKYQKPGQVYLHAVHRLDTPVSGVVVFAKTSKALSRLQALIREKETEKIYEAWVEGNIKSEQGSLEHWLIHGDHQALLGSPEDPSAKKCLLHYKVLERQNSLTKIEVNLETGRYHQIRAQFAFSCHPIWGDIKYGSVLKYPHDGIALHHSRFSIRHPIRDEVMVFRAQ